ncbi:arylsulfatase [Parvibaculum lavamentivorans]|nr:arylsulfatase [Parvibaculum lavamentivorans]
MGWNDLGYQGSEIRTPRIDALAARGVRLDRFYSQPMCSPTRAAMLTGNSAARLGIVGALSNANPTGLPLSQRILPEYLQEVGYQTSLVGKWHLGFRDRAYLPTSRGFDSFYGHLTGGIGYWDHAHAGRLDWQRLDSQGNGEAARDDGYSTHLIADEAVRIIETRNSDEPLFLYASFNAPHLPNEAPEEAIAAYDGIDDPKRRVHAAMVTELDTGVGRVMDTLEEQGMLDNTLVWFMSDNGAVNTTAYPEGILNAFQTLEEWFSGPPLTLTVLEFLRVNVLDGAGDNTPLHSGKRTIYEGAVRVPSFLYWKGVLEPRQVDAMVTVQDVLPSLLALLQYEVPNASFDGANQWPLLLDDLPGEARYVVTASDGEALFRYPWKLLRLNSGDLEFYNVELDPTEQNNLAEMPEHAQRIIDMSVSLDAQPRGEVVNLPFYTRLWRVDFFGGDEVGPPWIDQVQ